MKAKINWYYQQNGTKNSVTISIQNIVHPCVEVSTIKNVADIPRSIRNNKKVRQAVQKQPIFIADTYNDYILYGIDCRDHIEYER